MPGFEPSTTVSRNRYSNHMTNMLHNVLKIILLLCHLRNVRRVMVGQPFLGSFVHGANGDAPEKGYMFVLRAA